MRDKDILGEDGFLGPYYCILEIDNTQQMWWDPALPYILQTGPLWISYMENSEHRHDVFTGNTKPHKLNKNELIDRLHISELVVKRCKVDIVRKSK